jgi:hypothetical protein
MFVRQQAPNLSKFDVPSDHLRGGDCGHLQLTLPIVANHGSVALQLSRSAGGPSLI